MSATPTALHLLYEDEFDAWLLRLSTAARRWVRAQDWKAEKYRPLAIPNAAGDIDQVAFGLGKRQGGLSLWYGAALADRLPAGSYRLESLPGQEFSATESTQLQLGFAYGGYRFDRYRTCTAAAVRLEAIDGADQAYVGCTIEALNLARDWINTPAADFGPAELAAAAKDIAARHAAIYRECVGEELLRENFPVIHAVGRASATAPRLIELNWNPSGEAGRRAQITLVGKGVCFDSGGLDIKTAAGMLLMKKDMGGAACVLALAHMLMAVRIDASIRVLIPAVENSISADAYRPGDVLKTRKGLSVEVGNTDAEGRLILCDALTEADARGPDIIIDFATLTGAARVALGPELPALFGSDEAVVAELARVSLAEHDPLWPMPLWSGYDDELASKIADLNNVAASGFAGAIFGALFLRRFVTQTKQWLHIDLHAWNVKERPGRPSGAEAQSVRAVYRYLTGRYGFAVGSSFLG